MHREWPAYLPFEEPRAALESLKVPLGQFKWVFGGSVAIPIGNNQVILKEMEIVKGNGKVLVSLDGCGTMGYSQVLVLHKIARQIQSIGKLEETPPLSDHLDMIGGSGMGGIIALFIGRLRMKGDAAVQAYQRFSNEVYDNPGGTLDSTKYDWVVFEDSFRLIAKEAGYNADDPMEEENPKCKTMVLVRNARNGQPQAIRSYKVRFGQNPPFTILQAARAAMAAPNLFPSVYVGSPPNDYEFLSTFTNPIKVILEEAGTIFSDATKVPCLLSIGAGRKPDMSVPEDPKPNDYLKMLANIAEDCESVHKEIASRCGNLGIYHRLHVEQDLENIEFEEWNNFEYTQFVTHEYLEEYASRLENVCNAMVNPTGGPFLRDINRIPTLDVVFPPPPDLSSQFVGRTDLIETIITYHLSPPPPSVHKHWITLLHGLGGIGKTQLSLKVWLELKKRKPNLLVFFLDARSTNNLETGLQLLIRSRDARFWNKDHNDALNWLATTRYEWLAILDNADDPEVDLSAYIPHGQGNHIVITSRNPEHKILASHSSHQVGNLFIEESINLLLSISRLDHSEKNIEYARDIGAELDHHTLAVSQAGGYILKHGRISEYLKIFRRKRNQLLSKKHIQQPDYTLTVYATLQLSFDQLPPITQDILRVFSFLNSSQIEESILVQAAEASFVQKHEAIDEFPFQRTKMGEAANSLHKLLCFENEWDSYEFDQRISPALQSSLLLVTEAEDDRRFYSMHILMELFLRDTLPTDKASLADLAIRLVASTIKSDNSMTSLLWNRQLVPHILAIPLDLQVSPVDGYMMASLLVDNGKYKRAESYLAAGREQTLSQEVMKGVELTVRIQNLLAVTWNRMGRYPESAQLDDGILKIRRQLLGDEHPDTLTSMSNLVITLKDQGEYARATELGRQVLEIKRRVLGDEHPDTLSSMIVLTAALTNLGEYAQSAELGNQALDICKRVLGEEHPETLTSINNLALTMYNQGDYKQAAELGNRAVNIKKEVLGEEHPDTLLSMSNQALTLNRQGDYTQAAEMGNQVLDSRKRVLGEEHPDTLLSMNNLAFTLNNQGDYKKATELGNKTLDIMRRVLGKEHPYTLVSMNNLAFALRAQGDYTRAAELGNQVLGIRKKVLGEEHPDTLFSMNNLALTFNNQGDYTQAVELGNQVLGIRKRVLGEEHPDTLTSMHNLSLALRGQENYTQAAELGNQVVDIRKKVLGQTHPLTLESQENLASILQKLQEHREAAHSAGP